MIYLVPQNTDSDIDEIRGACIDSVLAVAKSIVEMPLANLENGEYWLYGRDSTGYITGQEVFRLQGSTVGFDNKSTDQFKLYPNPTDNLLTIETEVSDHYSIEITSLNGQQILIGEMEGTSHQIDLSSFQKGVYFITIRSKDFVTTRKIIKL
jgi:hypothetical protein